MKLLLTPSEADCFKILLEREDAVALNIIQPSPPSMQAEDPPISSYTVKRDGRMIQAKNVHWVTSEGIHMRLTSASVNHLRAMKRAVSLMPPGQIRADFTAIEWLNILNIALINRAYEEMEEKHSSSPDAHYNELVKEAEELIQQLARNEESITTMLEGHAKSVARLAQLRTELGKYN